MKKPWSSQEMSASLKSLSGKKKWIKEIAGIPTYLGASLLGLRYLESNVLVSVSVFVCFLMIYHFIYSFVFPGFDTGGRGRKLITFVVAQFAVWGATLWIFA